MVVPPPAGVAARGRRAERGRAPGGRPARRPPQPLPAPMADVTSTPTTTPASTPAAPRASFAEDFVDIFYAPSAVFARRREASPWPVVLVVTGLVMVASYIFFTLLGPAFERDMLRAMAEAPAEQRDAVMGFARWSTLFGAVVAVPVSVLVLGLVLWLAGKLFDADQPLRAAFLVVAFSWMPRVLESILTSLQAFVLDVNAVPSLAATSLSPARFIDTVANPALAQVLMRFGPFVIWSYVLIAIGLKVTGRIGGAKAAIAAAIVWVVGMVPSLLTLLRGTPG